MLLACSSRAADVEKIPGLPDLTDPNTLASESDDSMAETAMVDVVPSGPMTTMPEGPLLIVVPSIVIGEPPDESVTPPITTVPDGSIVKSAPPGPSGRTVGLDPNGTTVLVLGETMLSPAAPILYVVPEITSGGPPGVSVVSGLITTPPVGSAG